jgi:sulfur carrier protein ThiS
MPMILKLKLMGALKSKSPQGGTLDVTDGASINDVLQTLDIPANHVQIVMVNGKPQPNRDTPLTAEDDLTILAPVGGG